MADEFGLTAVTYKVNHSMDGSSATRSVHEDIEYFRLPRVKIFWKNNHSVFRNQFLEVGGANRFSSSLPLFNLRAILNIVATTTFSNAKTNLAGESKLVPGYQLRAFDIPLEVRCLVLSVSFKLEEVTSSLCLSAFFDKIDGLLFSRDSHLVILVFVEVLEVVSRKNSVVTPLFFTFTAVGRAFSVV